MPAYADYPHAERRIVVELAPPSPHLHQSERPFFEAPIRFTLSSSAKIVDFSSIGGSCHEEEESLGPSDVVVFSIVARLRVHYRAGPESWSDGSEGDEVV